MGDNYHGFEITVYLFNIGKQFIQFINYCSQLLIWHCMKGFLITPVVSQLEIHCPHRYGTLGVFSWSIIYEWRQIIWLKKMELTQADPHHVHIQYQNGEETTVSAWHLASVRPLLMRTPRDTCWRLFSFARKTSQTSHIKPGNTPQSMPILKDITEKAVDHQPIWIYRDEKYFKEKNIVIYLFTVTTVG